MGSILLPVKRYPQVAFWVIAWATFYFGWAMYVRTGSDAWQFMILGTLLGAVVVTAIADGWSGLKTFLGRIVRWRVSVKWYAVAILLPLALRLVALGLTVGAGAEIVANPVWNWGEIVFEAILVFFVIALGEEPAFRGFALVQLMKGRTALSASLVLGVLHGIWHLPLFLTGEDQWMVVLIIISGAILNTWLFNNTGGSVLLNMVMHTSVNLWVGIFNPLFSEADAARQTVWLALAYVAAAVIITLLAGRDLSRGQEARFEPVAVGPQLAGK